MSTMTTQDHTDGTKSHKTIAKQSTVNDITKRRTKTAFFLLFGLVLILIIHVTFHPKCEHVLMNILILVVACGVLYHSIAYWVVQWITEKALVHIWQAVVYLARLLFSDLRKATRAKK